MTEHSHTLFVIGIVMILAGPLIMFFGDRRYPLRGGIRLMLKQRALAEQRSLSGRGNRSLFGAAVMFAGVLVLLKALDVV